MNQMSWPSQVPPPPSPSSVPPPMPVAFSGKRSEFFALVKRGAALEFVTLGFYRFWLLTDMRRHLWANTVVDGDAAEYTGRGRELLIGFLVALAILVPIYLGYFLDRPRSRALPGLRQHSVGRFLLSVRPVRDLSRAALSPDAHGMARRAVLDEGLGLDLRLAGVAVGRVDGADAGPGVAVAHGGARTLQDAPFVLRRPSGQLRGPRLGVLQARLVAVAACAALPDAARALSLRCVQGRGVALVAVGHPVRRRAGGIDHAPQRTDRPVLESHRLDRRAWAGVLGLSGAVRRRWSPA